MEITNNCDIRAEAKKCHIVIYKSLEKKGLPIVGFDLFYWYWYIALPNCEFCNLNDD